MIGIVGISHKTANVNVREMFTVSGLQLEQFTNQIALSAEIEEVYVLSTCNRTEVYFYKNCTCGNKTIRLIREYMHGFHSLTDDYSSMFYAFTNQQAIRHLFEVASGIDSMLIGEYQIVKQIKDAYDCCTKIQSTKVILKRLLHKALETGKQVRSQTSIQKGAISVSYAAINLCVENFESLKQKRVLFIGAGETIKLAIFHLLKKGARNFTIVNRTLESAQLLANQFNGEAKPLTDLPLLLPENDIIIAATDAGKLLVNFEDVEAYQEENSTQLFIDLSVPRNIDDTINELPNKMVKGIDSVSDLINNTKQKREENLHMAQAIIQEKVMEFMEWKRMRALKPLIHQVTENLNKLHESELELNKQIYTADEIAVLKAHSARLTTKYIRNIIKGLKKISISENDPKAMEKIYNLFQFNEK